MRDDHFHTIQAQFREMIQNMQDMDLRMRAEFTALNERLDRVESRLEKVDEKLAQRWEEEGGPGLTRTRPPARGIGRPAGHRQAGALPQGS